MKRVQAQQILKKLDREFPLAKSQRTWAKDPFKTLIATIISQNTNDKNAAKAFRHLSHRFRISPEVLAFAETSQIRECLRVGGLYNAKANAIKQISKEILETYAGNINQILSMSLEKARKSLMQLTGIGPKTADIVLLFSAGKPTIPVDTHVNRVSKRLQLAPEKANYEIVRNSLQTTFKPKNYLTVHVLLIAHGRKYCKARRPLCSHCPVNDLCQSRMDVKDND